MSWRGVGGGGGERVVLLATTCFSSFSNFFFFYPHKGDVGPSPRSATGLTPKKNSLDDVAVQMSQFSLWLNFSSQCRERNNQLRSQTSQISLSHSWNKHDNTTGVICCQWLMTLPT